MDHIESDNTGKKMDTSSGRKALYLKISDSIFSYIKVNRLKPGDKLPSEREMSAMFETSRNSVREALRILEDRGLIYIKTNSGTFLKNPYGETNSLEFNLTDCSLSDIEQLQAALDRQTVLNVIARASAAEKENLVTTASEMMRLAENNMYSHVLDHSFHSSLYECGGNSAIRLQCTKIRDFRFICQEDTQDGNDSIWLPTVKYHLSLAESLLRNHAEDAIKAIERINDYGFSLSKKQRLAADLSYKATQTAFQD